MNNPKVSIIVPVYKVEKYLGKCVDSIIGQTYTDWELLLIDDGSPDKSGELCDIFSKQDSRIKTFHKPNGGVSSARNLGLDNAQGEYVMFVDSDDWIDEHCLEWSINEVKEHKLDAVQFGFMIVHSDNRSEVQVKNTSSILCGEDYIINGTYNVCAWGGLYENQLIKDLNLKFDTQIKLGEDQLFILSLIRHCDKVKYISETLYFYYQNPCGAVYNQKSVDMLKSCVELAKLGTAWKPIKKHCDCMCVGFLVDSIKDGASEKEISRIYRLTHPCNYISSSGSVVLYYKLAKVCPFVAYWIVNILFKIKR